MTGTPMKTHSESPLRVHNGVPGTKWGTRMGVGSGEFTERPQEGTADGGMVQVHVERNEGTQEST